MFSVTIRIYKNEDSIVNSYNEHFIFMKKIKSLHHGQYLTAIDNIRPTAVCRCLYSTLKATAAATGSKVLT
jgi:hypothetical protein